MKLNPDPHSAPEDAAPSFPFPAGEAALADMDARLKLIRKLRWIGLEDEAAKILNGLPAEARADLTADRFGTD